MLDTILFACDVPAFARFAEEEIRKHAPNLSFVNITDLASLGELSDEALSNARLIGFTTGLIVPRSILVKLGCGAYNFHPGPPEYPGWDPIRFAIYEDARQFGVTAHVMAAQIDAGAIVGVKRFAVKQNAIYTDLQAGMVDALLQLFRELAEALIGEAGPPAADIAWAPKRFTRQMALDLCALHPDIGADELSRRIRAFGTGEVSLRPTLKLHGASFVYAPDDILRPSGAQRQP